MSEEQSVNQKEKGINIHIVAVRERSHFFRVD